MNRSMSPLARGAPWNATAYAPTTTNSAPRSTSKASRSRKSLFSPSSVVIGRRLARAEEAARDRATIVRGERSPGDSPGRVGQLPHHRDALGGRGHVRQVIRGLLAEAKPADGPSGTSGPPKRGGVETLV